MLKFEITKRNLRSTRVDVLQYSKRLITVIEQLHAALFKYLHQDRTFFHSGFDVILIPGRRPNVQGGHKVFPMFQMVIIKNLLQL